MLQKSEILGYFAKWRFYCMLLTLLSLLLFFILVQVQDYEIQNLHYSIRSVFQWPNEVPVLNTREISNSTIEEPIWGEDHIMFLETSCILSDGAEKRLASRQICSIESAAKTNPTRKVYLLHSCPLPSIDHGVGPIYSKYRNIKFWPLRLEDLQPGSPLEDWSYKTHLNSSRWPREHGSDISRFLVLWQYGGTYFDLDIMLIRELSGIAEENFISREQGKILGSAALRFLAHNDTSRSLLRTVMMQVRNDFRGWDWGYNGPGALQRAVEQLCLPDQSSPMPSSCMGVNLLRPKYFFEIPYLAWRMFFRESQSDEVMERLRDSYGVHFWNKLSHEEKVFVGSKQAYGRLAQQYCPHFYNSVFSSF